MRPVVRVSLALAALCALTAPLGRGSAPRTRIVSAAPGPSAASPSKTKAESTDLSAVCPAGQLPDGEVCVAFDRAALRAPLQNAEGAPPSVVRGAAADQIPRREGRPASLDAYRLPVVTLASAPRLGARGGVEVDVPAGAVVFALSLDRQDGAADVLAIEPASAVAGGAAGLRIFTHHLVGEGDAKAEIVLSTGPIAILREGLAAGTKLADGDRLGVTAAEPITLRVEARRLRDGLDIASLAGPSLLAEDRALRTDPRNVLPLR